MCGQPSSSVVVKVRDQYYQQHQLTKNSYVKRKVTHLTYICGPLGHVSGAEVMCDVPGEVIIVRH